MFRRVKIGMFIICLAAMIGFAPERVQADGEFDGAKYKLQLNGWISRPHGYFNGADKNDYFGLQKDFGFGSYATFDGGFDWRFKGKRYPRLAPVMSSRITTWTRTIEWQGQTYDIGTRVDADGKSVIFWPDYQFDFFRKKQGWVGLVKRRIRGHELSVPVGAHWDARVGYSMGSQLKIADSNDNISRRLVQKGPVIGLAYHWGKR